jgi:hypothetical protein
MKIITGALLINALRREFKSFTGLVPSTAPAEAAGLVNLFNTPLACFDTALANSAAFAPSI